MAKRKNPLKDLDAFLKQEASSLVNPDKIKSETPHKSALNTSDEPKASQEPEVPSREMIVAGLQALARQDGGNFRESLYSIIRETLEKTGSSTPADKMLINTILYLNDQSNWKENIRNYWDGR